jgi:hypothetical protein
MSVTVSAGQTCLVTNTVVISSVTPASGSGTNTVIDITMVGGTLAITTEPSNAVAVSGASALFQVEASGTLPLSYQWYFDSTNSISDATNAQLSLTNVQPAQAGNYTVIVSGSAGSISSVPAVLRVLVQPAIIDGSVAVSSGSGLSLSINSVAGLNYTLEYKNFLDDPAWTILPASAVAGTGGVITLQDTSPQQAQRFYQIIAN